MTNDEALEKMLAWLHAEIEKAKLPGQDPFILTSLTYCARQSVGAETSEQLKPRLWQACAEMAKKTFDVFTPDEAIGVVEWSIDRDELSKHRQRYIQA